jgi:hypothetical protein
MGEEVARRAQVRLAGYAGSAYAAMIVKERAGEGWVPVGEEDFYAVVRKDEGFDVVVLCEEFFSFSVMFLKVCGRRGIYTYSPQLARSIGI